MGSSETLLGRLQIKGGLLIEEIRYFSRFRKSSCQKNQNLSSWEPLRWNFFPLKHRQIFISYHYFFHPYSLPESSKECGRGVDFDFACHSATTTFGRMQFPLPSMHFGGFIRLQLFKQFTGIFLFPISVNS
jgi:hypothetical protein